MFLALLSAHFNPRYARAKMILSRAKNIFMPANVNSIVIILFLLLFFKKNFFRMISRHYCKAIRLAETVRVGRCYLQR